MAYDALHCRSFRKRAIIHRFLLQNMICRNKASYASAPPCRYVDSMAIYSNSFITLFQFISLHTGRAHESVLSCEIRRLKKKKGGHPPLANIDTRVHTCGLGAEERVKSDDREILSAYTHMFVCTYTHTYIHTYIHAYRQTYTHTYIHA